MPGSTLFLAPVCAFYREKEMLGREVPGTAHHVTSHYVILLAEGVLKGKVDKPVKKKPLKMTLQKKQQREKLNFLLIMWGFLHVLVIHSFIEQAFIKCFLFIV